MLVRAKQDMVYRNALKKAGDVFDYDGTKAPVCCEAIEKKEPQPVDSTAKRTKKTDN